MSSSVLTEIDTGVKETKKVVEDLQGLSKKISKVKDAGTSLKNIKSIIDSSAFSNLSMGLSSVSAILGIVSMFSGGKSSTDQILDAISGVDNKIDNLQDLIIGKFDLMFDKISDEIRVTSLLSKCSEIDASVRHLNIFLNAKNDGERVKAIEELCSGGTKHLYDTAELINDELHGKLHPDHLGLMAVRSSSSNGDAKAVLDLYLQLFNYLESAIIINNFIDVIEKLKTKNIELPDIEDTRNLIEMNITEENQSQIGDSLSYNQKFYGPIFATLEKYSEDTIDKCLRDVKSNITSYLEIEIIPKIKSDDSVQISKDIISNLEKKFSWLSHISIVYDSMSGFKKHIVSNSGTGGYITFFRKKLHGKTEKNIVVIYANPDKKIDVKSIDRKISVTYTVIPTHGMVPRSNTINTYAEEFDWNYHSMSLQEAVKKIRAKNNNTSAVIWMGKRHSHTHCEISKNFKIDNQWHYSKKSPYSIGIFE